VVQPPLEFLDVVTTQLRGFEEQRAVTELMTCFDNRKPGLFIADAITIQPASFLEAPYGFCRGRAKITRLGTYRGKSGGTEAAL
jgi:hypothetical protein